MTDIETRVAAVLNEIRGHPGVTTRPGISVGDLGLLEERLRARLPAAYRALLERTNGLEWAHGSRRLLGYGPGAPIDIVRWNDPDTWKWAYSWLRDDLDEYVAFEVGVEGILTVCRREDLSAMDADPTILTLTPGLMRLGRPGVTFTQWFERGIRGQVRRPVLNDDDRRLFQRFPELPPDQLLVHPAMLWVTGEGDVEQQMLLPADQAMVANADLQREAQQLTEGDQVVAIDVYTDDRGRARVRYVTRAAP